MNCHNCKLSLRVAPEVVTHLDTCPRCNVCLAWRPLPELPLHQAVACDWGHAKRDVDMACTGAEHAQGLLLRGVSSYHQPSGWTFATAGLQVIERDPGARYEIVTHVSEGSLSTTYTHTVIDRAGVPDAVMTVGREIGENDLAKMCAPIVARMLGVPSSHPAGDTRSETDR